jgi:hypothetical protein
VISRGPYFMKNLLLMKWTGFNGMNPKSGKGRKAKRSLLWGHYFPTYPHERDE